MATNEFAPRLVLQQLIQSFQVPQCIYVVAKLGIADLLKEGPRRCEQLAEATGTHAGSLYRVLRLLTAVDLFTEDESHTFALTPLGAYLRTEVSGSLRTMALAYGEQPFWPVWGALLHSVQTGEPSFQHIFGHEVFDYYAQHPNEAALFNDFMTDLTSSVAPTVAAAYDFSASSSLVDVGGGHGQMLAAILQAHPTLQGVLYDLPPVVKGHQLCWRALAWLTAAGSWREMPSRRFRLTMTPTCSPA